jgi:hypothetical protein
MSTSWKLISEEQRKKGIVGEIAKFEDELDPDFIQVREITIHEDEETMQRAVAERDNHSG